MRDECQFVGNSLPNNQTIKRVFMFHTRQVVEGRRIGRCYWQYIKTRLADNCRKIIRSNSGECQFSGGEFERNLPDRYHTDRNRHFRILDAISSFFSKTGWVKQRPEEGVSIK